jgi:hypothetical protein
MLYADCLIGAVTSNFRVLSTVFIIPENIKTELKAVFYHKAMHRFSTQTTICCAGTKYSNIGFIRNDLVDTLSKPGPCLIQST